jgi:hypothetical protein
LALERLQPLGAQPLSAPADQLILPCSMTLRRPQSRHLDVRRLLPSPCSPSSIMAPSPADLASPRRRRCVAVSFSPSPRQCVVQRPDLHAISCSARSSTACLHPSQKVSSLEVDSAAAWSLPAWNACAARVPQKGVIPGHVHYYACRACRGRDTYADCNAGLWWRLDGHSHQANYFH